MIKLRQFADDEELKPLPKETAETMKEFFDTQGEFIVEVINYMKDQSKHPMNKIIPFLHGRQLGIERNIIFSMENAVKPALIINAEFIVQDKKHVKQGVEVSESFMVEGKEHIKRVFIAERSEKILLKYSEYTDGETPMTNGSDDYEGEYAVLLQEAIDFSNGKLITRFPEIVEEKEDSATIEGVEDGE
jgi:hypothetical protein